MTLHLLHNHVGEDDLMLDPRQSALPPAAERLLRHWDLPEKTNAEWESLALAVDARVALLNTTTPGLAHSDDWVLEAPLPPGVLRTRTAASTSRLLQFSARFGSGKALLWSGFAAAAAIALVVGLTDFGKLQRAEHSGIKPASVDSASPTTALELRAALDTPTASLEQPPGRNQNAPAPVEISQLPEIQWSAREGGLEIAELEPESAQPQRHAARRAVRGGVKPPPEEAPVSVPIAEPQAAPSKPGPRLVPAADGTGFPDRPSLRSVQTVLDPLLATARPCVAGHQEPSQVALVFGSDGQLRSIRVTEPANSTSAAACIRRALSPARVKPFSEESFGVRVWIRP